MARYYVAGIPFDDENCLKHYGVKGMKWDQHLFGPDANTKYINWMNDIGKFANKAAKGVGTAVTNAAKTVGSAVNKGANFVTGNQAKQNLNAAKNANPADPNYQAKVNRYQGQYNQTLPGMAGQAAQNATNWVNQAGDNVRNGNVANAVSGAVTNAANAVGDWTRGAVNDATNWVNQAGDNVRNGNVANAVGNAANQARGGIGGFFDRVGDWGRGAVNDVGNAVTNAGNAVGDWTRGAVNDATNWVNQAGDNVRNGNVANAVSGAADNARKGASGFINSAGQWVSNAANNVGSAVSNAAQDAKNFMDYRVTGAGYDKLDPSNPEVQEAFKDISKSHSSQLSVDPSITGFSVDPRMVYSPQEAMQFAKEVADMGRNNSLFGRVGNAANVVGDWTRGAVNDATNWVNQAGDNVRNGNVANAITDVYNNSPVLGGLDRAVLGAAQNAGNWIGDRARDAGNAVGNFVDSNITGNTQRRNAEMYNRTAQNPNADSVARAMNQIAANNAQANADATLFGRVGNAANAVGDWAGQAARNVGGAVTNAGNAAGDWIRGAAQNAGSAVTNAGNAVGDWTRGAVSDAANFLTGNRSREELMRAMQQDYSFPNAQARYDYGVQALQNLQNTLPSIAGRAVNNVGDWVNQAGDNVRNWIDDRFINHSALDDKPEGVTDAFWSNYVASGGTREQYERDWK